MTDALVTLLNRYHYQPVFLPHTGLVPPELYTFTKHDGEHRLVRRGPLQDYLPEQQIPAPKDGKVADIEHKQTSGKRMDDAISFLKETLACIGISNIPTLNLSFTNAKEFIFKFTGVTNKQVDPSVLDHLIEEMATGAIPQPYIEAGNLHIVYEYLYSNNLLMQRSDNQSFGLKADGKIGDFINLGASGKAEMQSETTISFHGTNPNETAAFAYKAGRLTFQDGRWWFFPEELMKSVTGQEKKIFYIPARGVVLRAVV